MNQFFSFKRFHLLVWKHWADNKKRYGLSVLALIGLLATWFPLTKFIERDLTMSEEMQRATYFFSLFVAGTLYASQYFRDLGWRAKGINFLLVPASAFEKFLCSLLYTVVLFFGVFTAAFYLVDILMVTLFNSFAATDGAAEKATLVNVFTTVLFRFHDGSVINFLPFFFSIQSAFLLGSVYFRKYSFIKTIISGFILYTIFFCLVYFSCRKFFTEDDSGYLPAWVGQVSSILTMYVIGPFLWIVTYYRLKVKQV